jgi:hypothetical protein
MADKKISELTAYTPAVDVDLVPIVDTTTGITKHITWANIKATLKTYFDSLTTTLTNKTLTSPKIGTAIADTSGNEIIKTPATGSAVNEITVTNSATGNAVEISATGDDTNIDLKLSGKGTGGIKDKNNDYLSSNNSMARQAIINGNFDVWQRGVTVTPADPTTTFLADHWFDHVQKDGGTLPTLTRTREILTSGDIPNAFYYSRLTTNGAGTSLGASSYHRFRQRIENGTRFLCGNGKKVTLSFYARSSIANKRLGIMCYQSYGTGGSPSTVETIITKEPITLTSSWTKYTATFTTNTLAGKTFGTANDDTLTFDLISMWGSTFGNASVYPSVSAETYVGSGTIDIAQVQLCAGDVALPFMPKSYDEELRACQRYCQVISSASNANTPIGTGFCYSTTLALPFRKLDTTMRIKPTIESISDVGHFMVAYAGGGASTTTDLNINQANESALVFGATVASGLTAGHGSSLLANTTSARITLTAEL